MAYKFYDDILKLDDKAMCSVAEEDWDKSETDYSQQFADMDEDRKAYWLEHSDVADIDTSHAGSSEPEEATRASFKQSYSRSRIDTAVSIIMVNLFPDYNDWLNVSPKTNLMSDDDNKRMNLIERFKQYRLWR